jgi:hypothetical protein
MAFRLWFTNKSLKVALIAGNIPLGRFSWFLSVLITGNSVLVKHLQTINIYYLLSKYIIAIEPELIKLLFWEGN